MDRVIMFRPARLSEIILQHDYFVGIRTTQMVKTQASCTNQATQLNWGLLRETKDSQTHQFGHPIIDYLCAPIPAEAAFSN